MQTYVLRDLSLVLESPKGCSLDGLESLLWDLNFARDGVVGSAGAVRLSVSYGLSFEGMSHQGRETLNVDGIQGLESDKAFYLICDTAAACIEFAPVVATVRLTPGFFNLDPLLQRNFWSFVLMKLLRVKGIFVLHAAALTSPQGQGLLIVASPGSGKSTLAIGLVKHGWGYLSDDAVLLRLKQGNIEAIALRRHFYIDADVNDRYADLDPCNVCEDTHGDGRHRLDMRSVFPNNYRSACKPSHLLFPHIVSQSTSIIESITRGKAMNLLLNESGPQLFDKSSMSNHLSVLRALIDQCDLIQLNSGRDLLEDPGLLIPLLNSSTG